METLRKWNLRRIVVVIYLVFSIAFAIDAFFERAGYALISSRIFDALFAFILWPILLIARLMCHSGNILKIFESCKYLPFGFS